ncbi:hypothetical protein PG984_015500 [Apiospora sp. TS-2023a]
MFREWVRVTARRRTGTEQPQSTSGTTEGSHNDSKIPEQRDEHVVAPQETSPRESHPDDTGSLSYSDSTTLVDAATLTCRVCLEAQPTSSFPQSALLTAQCNHPARTCLACTQTWIQTQLLSRNDWTHLACPECLAPMSPNDVQRYATPEMLAKYRAGVIERPALRLFSATAPMTLEQAEDAKRRVVEGQRQRRMHEAREVERARLVAQRGAHERAEAERQTLFNFCVRWMQERESKRTILATTRECPNPRCRVRQEKSDGW